MLRQFVRARDLLQGCTVLEHQGRMEVVIGRAHRAGGQQCLDLVQVVDEIRGEPIEYLLNKQYSSDQQRFELDMLQGINRRHAALHHDDPQLEARIQAYELAFRMQARAPTRNEAISEWMSPQIMSAARELDLTWKN
jgi:hypothetical protein